MSMTLSGGIVSAGLAAKRALAEEPEAGGSIVVLATTPGGRDPQLLLESIRRSMEEELRATGAPGLTLALSAPSGFSAAVTAGYADLASRMPVRADHRFEIGSVSKSLVALSAFMLAQEGRLDLDGKVSEAAPDLHLPAEPITVVQLLNHCSGLPTNAPLFPRPTDGHLWSGFEPGSRFSYCNTGYDILAQIVSRSANLPFPLALKRLTLDRIGMVNAIPAVLNRDRSSVVTSYVPLQPDRPFRAGDPVAPAAWVENDAGAGSIGATPADMALYLDFLGKLLTGRTTPLHDRALIARFLAPVMDAPDFGVGARYANGLATVSINERSCLYHSGGTFSFSSALVVDRESGVGCFVSANIGGTPYRPKTIAAYAAQALRTFQAGGEVRRREVLTAPPSKLDRGLVGRFVSGEMGALDIAIHDHSPWVTFEGKSGRLEPLGNQCFVADHPKLALHTLSFEPSTGIPDRLWWGGSLFGRGQALATPSEPASLLGLTGRYRNNDPWWDPASLIVRDGKLILEGSGELKPHPDGSWRFVDAALAMERVWIDGRINGRTTRLNISGTDFVRLDAYDS